MASCRVRSQQLHESTQRMSPPPSQVKELTRDRRCVMVQPQRPASEAEPHSQGYRGWVRVDSIVSVQGPRRGPRAHSGTTRYRVHRGKLVPKPRNLQAEVRTSGWPCLKTQGLNKTETAAKAMDDAGWQWPGRTGVEAAEQVRNWWSVKGHIWVPLTDEGIRLVQNKHSIVSKYTLIKRKNCQKLYIFLHTLIISEIYMLQSWHHILHTFLVLSLFLRKLCWPYLNLLHSHHTVYSLWVWGSINCHPPLPYGRYFHYMHSWALCSWTMTLVDASMKATLTFICNCLFTSLFPLICSNQLGNWGHDSSLDPESLEQVCPDPQWVHNECWLSQLIHRRFKRKKRKHTWWANTDRHLINSCIQPGANTIPHMTLVMLRKNNRIGLCQEVQSKF